EIRARALLALAEGHLHAHISMMLVSREAAQCRGTPEEAERLRLLMTWCLEAQNSFETMGYQGLALRAARTIAECFDLLGDEQGRDRIVEELRRQVADLGF